MNSYASLQARWGREKDLKAWWDSKTENEQVEWYRKQQQLSRGQKRKYEVHVRDTTEDVAKDGQQEVDIFETWEEFQCWGMMAGKSEAALQQEFQELVEDPNVDCVWARGQWCVPKFKGVKRYRGTEHLEATATVRVANIETTADA